MEHPPLPPTPSSSSLSQPADARQVLLPVLAGIALLAVGVFVYFQFFSQDPKSAFHEEPSGEVQESADEASEKDAVYQADYDEGYSAGYADGRLVNGEFYDSYDEPATLERQDGYFEGYFAGFLRGCEEGDFDCSAIENYRIDYDAAYDAGYLDGYEEFRAFFDSYSEPLEEYRQQCL
ncbi:hypothetical protein EBT25_04830 [bacterium]|nr:hypothetical protein [bacterium]